MAGLIGGAIHSATRTPTRERRFVTFLLDRWELGIEVGDVCGIYHGLPIIPTPDESDPVAGDVSIYGQRIPVLKLRHLLNLSPLPSLAQWLVVFREQGQTAALIVDRVYEVISVDVSALEQQNAASGGPASDYANRAVFWQGRKIYLPDFPRLLADCWTR
jgi:chemotaxis signal transduction protein